MPNLLRELVLLIIALATFCELKVIINLQIFNYRNPDDIIYNGGKCENFHWLGDNCDPMFDVCVTSYKRCDLLDYFISHGRNKKYVWDVLTTTIYLNNMKRSFTVDVTATDHDKYDAHDHIAKFTSRFYISKLNTNYGNQMSVSPRGLNVHLYASISMQCVRNFYGYNCDVFCQMKMFNYRCDSISGHRICLIDCGKHGSCEWQSQSQLFSCKCNNGWTGDQCRNIHYSNCSQMSCKGVCVYHPSHKSCDCVYGAYMETCKEILKMTTTTLEQTTTTILHTTTLTPITTVKHTTTLKQSTTVVSKTEIISKTLSAKIKMPQSNNKESITMKKSDFTKRRKLINTSKENITQHLASLVKNTQSPTATIIICLLIPLCICVIILSLAIYGWKKKYKIKNTGSLSPVFYQPTLTGIPQDEYDGCHLRPDDNCERKLINFDSGKYNNDDDAYEEPNVQTEIMERDDNYSDHY